MVLTKQEVIDKSCKYWNPHRTKFWQNLGINLVIGWRENYYIFDMDGRRFLDCHINGGTYNFGHRNPELIEALQEALAEGDVGNHHFPSPSRALLAEKLALMTPGDLRYSVFTTSGSEAIDVAIKTARNATGKSKIVSVEKCFHGHSGYAMEIGDSKYVDMFVPRRQPDRYQQIPFNDPVALETILEKGDVAAFIVETVPATFGFLMPDPGYLQEVRRITKKYGAIYIADEVQTGLLRSGKVWCVETYNVVPDILVTGKGFGGGLYPIAAAIISKQCSGWIENDGYGHISTYGGSELGCKVALKVLDICARPEIQMNVQLTSKFLRSGLDNIKETYPYLFSAVRQNGLIMGLEFNHPHGAVHVMRELYKNGVWAIFSSYNQSVLQFKPGIFWDKKLSDEFLDCLNIALFEVQKKLGNKRAI